jgi:glycerol-3-phosphate dehydrogenase
MPITEAVAAVIHEGLSPRGIIPMLMGREAKSERFEFNR